MIDKDRASALLATELGVDLFAISTDTDYVYLDYKKPDPDGRSGRWQRTELEQYYRRRDIFRPGNMGPKIESALRFLRAAAKKVITSYEHLCEAVAGRAGTHIVQRCRTV